MTQGRLSMTHELHPRRSATRSCRRFGSLATRLSTAMLRFAAGVRNLRSSLIYRRSMWLIAIGGGECTFQYERWEKLLSNKKGDFVILQFGQTTSASMTIQRRRTVRHHRKVRDAEDTRLDPERDGHSWVVIGIRK